MSHTYGEVLPCSYNLIYQYCDKETVLFDVGSGYADILFTALQQDVCKHAIGIEKYKDKYDASIKTKEAKPESIQQRLTFVMEDVNDCDFEALLKGLEFEHVVLFCNNVAFNQGTIIRSGVKFRAVMESLISQGKKATTISMMPLPALKEHIVATIPLDTTWNKAHVTEVYQIRSS